MADNKTTALDDLLDETLDDLKDLPEFKPYPPGAHHVRINWEAKQLGDDNFFELKMKLIETKELADPAADVAPEAGSETSVLYSRTNEFGQGAFKKLMLPIGEKLGIKSIKELLKATNGAEALIVSKLRKGKKKDGKDEDDTKYMQVVEMEIL